MPGNPAPTQIGTGKSAAAPVPGGVGSPSAPNITQTATSPCLISWPSADVPLVGSVGGGCILSKTNVRAMLAGLIIAGGAALGVGAVLILVGAGFRKSKAVDVVAGFVPGGAAVAGAVRSGRTERVQQVSRERTRSRGQES